MYGWPGAANSDDRLKLLRELRSRLVDAVDSVECARDLEPLCRRLDVISAEIDELAGQREATGTPVDVINARREARRRAGLPVTPARTGDPGERTHG